jgi:nicotinamidase-related amidase
LQAPEIRSASRALALCVLILAFGTPGATAQVAIPTLPPPVPVVVDGKTTAYLVLDVTSVICAPQPACQATLPAAASLLAKARQANAPVIYSETPTPGSTILAEVAPRPAEPKVTGRADKFYGTPLDDILKSKGAKTLVIVGTAANGAVLYTAFGANVRGYTVVVATDGISAAPFPMLLAQYQLLNQPGFANPDNAPLAESKVTLSRSDLITFR